MLRIRVFVKRIQWCIVLHIVVQMDMPVDGVCIRSTKTRLVARLAVKHEQNVVYANLP